MEPTETSTTDQPKDQPVEHPDNASEPSGTPPAQTQYIGLVKEIAKQLTIADKNFQLYPQHGQVAQGSLDTFHRAVEAYFDEADFLALTVAQIELRYEDIVVYREPEKGRSIAFRLYKDGVRQVILQPEVRRQELSDLLECLRDSRRVDEDEEDFATLFWQKDAPHIQVQLAEDLGGDEQVPTVPTRNNGIAGIRTGGFLVPAEEKERLEKVLENRKADDGETTFVISEEEANQIGEMVRQEDSYLPLHDFLDILLELMVRNPDPSAFARSVKMIRTIIAALVEDLEFSQAAFLMEKLSLENHPGLTEAHLAQIREMLSSFADKQTVHFTKVFLQEHRRLAKEHGVFKFLRAFPVSSADTLCEFLELGHVEALCDVLAAYETDVVEHIEAQLLHPNEVVAKAVMEVLLRVEEPPNLGRIARTLNHPCEAVRVHAARKLVDLGNESAAPTLLPLLRESSPQLLNLALQFFAKVACPRAYDEILGLCEGPSFHDLDPKRQKLCFKALLQASSVRALTHIENSVLRRAWSLTGTSRRRKAAAIEALSLHPGEEAQRLLERFAASRHNPLAKVATEALRTRKIAAQVAGRSASRATENTAEVQHG